MFIKCSPLIIFIIALGFIFGCNSNSTEPHLGIPDATNHKPVIDSLLANPESIAVGDTSYIRVYAHDPDAGDKLEAQFSIHNGALYVNGFTAKFVGIMPGEDSVNVKVNDDKGLIAEKTAIVTVTK